MFCYSKYFTCLFLSLSLPLTAQASLAREGGVSGGGGNVINPQVPNRPMDLERAEQVVKSSLSHTRAFFAHAKVQYQRGQGSPEILSVYRKLFSNDENLRLVLKTVRPQIREHGPCYDYDQNPVDASVVSSQPDRFCISSFALSRKVLPEFIAAQAAALMAHEYTEIAGLGEFEAVLIQKQVLQDLQRLQESK